jgi:hypothetical protein
MHPKTIAESKKLAVLPGEHPIPELEVWDPPFERWMRIADDLLRRSVLRQTPPGDATILKH